MILYSKKITKFISEIKHRVAQVLSTEVCLRVERTRFYDYRTKRSYPINIVIYNNKRMLGYFDPNFYELGFHECLMRANKEQLHNIIRHELAHYLTFINYGKEVQSHGVEFRTFCQQMGWSEEVSKATICLEAEEDSAPREESSVFRKIQKLMALTTSSSKNEAEQAMIKSQQLLLKHCVDSKDIENEDEERFVLKRIMKQKKENAKMRSVGKILETFFVSVVYRRAESDTYLEVLGNAVNVEIAEYVAETLYREMDKLWIQAQQQACLKGRIAKNSFFLGIAKGYCNKIQALTRDYNSDTTNALIVIEKKLTDAKALAYQRLYSKRSRVGYCQESSILGEQAGKALNFTPAVKNKSSKSFLKLFLQ